MTAKERALNQQSLQGYKNADLKIDMIPGFNSTSSSRLNYLISPANSLGKQPAGYNPVTGAPYNLASPKSNPFQDRVQLDNGYHYQPPQRSPSLGLLHQNRSLNEDAYAGQGRQGKLQNNASSLGTYNPITNPIPNQNQNPYFRGRDNVGSSKNLLAMAADTIVG